MQTFKHGCICNHPLARIQLGFVEVESESAAVNILQAENVAKQLWEHFDFDSGGIFQAVAG